MTFATALRHDGINADSFLAYIRGIGEKFGANPVTGTGSVDLPLCFSPGRSGFGPGLALHSDSGAGNGPFSFGWTRSLPAITRKTELGQRQPFPTPLNSMGWVCHHRRVHRRVDSFDSALPPRKA